MMAAMEGVAAKTTKVLGRSPRRSRRNRQQRPQKSRLSLDSQARNILLGPISRLRLPHIAGAQVVVMRKLLSHLETRKIVIHCSTKSSVGLSFLDCLISNIASVEVYS